MGYFITQYTKISTNWVKDLNVRPETIGALKPNIGIMLFDIRLSNNLFSFISSDKRHKRRINKRNYIRLKTKAFTQHRKLINRTKKTTYWMEKDICKQYISVQFSSVQSLSCVQLFATPWTTTRQASPSITNSRSPPKPMSIESVMPSN